MSVRPAASVVVPRSSTSLQQACFAVTTPDMRPASQTKAGQAYDSAAQGAAQAKDYTQASGCPGLLPAGPPAWWKLAFHLTTSCFIVGLFRRPRLARRMTALRRARPRRRTTRR